MAEQRAGGLEKAVFWIEYTAKYGADHLRSPLADASIVDYLMLDIIALVAVVFLMIVALILSIVKMLMQKSKQYEKIYGSKKTN